MARRAVAKQDQALRQQRSSRIVRASLLVSAIVFSFVAVSLLVLDQVMRPGSFPINQLRLEGQFKWVKPQAIEALVLQHQRGNFFSVNLLELEQHIEAESWVESATVRRAWPDTLWVQVSEQKPVMRLNDDAWVNIRGEVIQLPDFAGEHEVIQLLGRHEQAKTMLLKALRWSNRFDQRSLQLREVKLSDSGAWTVRLRYKDSIDGVFDEFNLLLGAEQLDQRLARFEQLFDRRFRFSHERLERADARYPDGIAVKSKLAGTSQPLGSTESGQALSELSLRFCLQPQSNTLRTS